MKQYSAALRQAAQKPPVPLKKQILNRVTFDASIPKKNPTSRMSEEKKKVSDPTNKLKKLGFEDDQIQELFERVENKIDAKIRKGLLLVDNAKRFEILYRNVLNLGVKTYSRIIRMVEKEALETKQDSQHGVAGPTVWKIKQNVIGVKKK